MPILTQNRKDNETYGQKPKWGEAGAVALFILAIIGIGISSNSIYASGGNVSPQYPRTVDEAIPNKSAVSPCIEIASGTRSYICADKETLAKWKTWLEKENEELRIDAGKPSAILSKVCRDHGFAGQSCPALLYGMAMTESGMRWDVVGDRGESIGFFQIHRGFHPSVSRACATDLKCSATWTLNRLVRYGYPADAASAIMHHNGTPGTTATTAYLATVEAMATKWKR